MPVITLHMMPPKSATVTHNQAPVTAFTAPEGAVNSIIGTLMMGTPAADLVEAEKEAQTKKEAKIAPEKNEQINVLLFIVSQLFASCLFASR
jgi:hypothetical protein